MAVLYSTIFWGCWFFDEVSEEKNQLRSLQEHCEPSSLGSRSKGPEHFSYFAFWIAQNIAPVVICLFLDQLTVTLLRLWGSVFGIPNWYTSFKIALDMALYGYIKKVTILPIMWNWSSLLKLYPVGVLHPLYLKDNPSFPFLALPHY